MAVQRSATFWNGSRYHSRPTTLTNHFLAQEVVPADGDPVVVGRVVVVDAGDRADVVEGAAILTIGASSSAVPCSRSGRCYRCACCRPRSRSPTSSRSPWRRQRRSSGSPPSIAVSPDSAMIRAFVAFQDQPAHDRLAACVGETHLHDLRRADLLDVAEVEGVTPSSSLSNSSFPSYIETILPLSHSSDFSRIQSKSVGRPSGRLRLPGLLGVVGSSGRRRQHRGQEFGHGQAGHAAYGTPCLASQRSRT